MIKVSIIVPVYNVEEYLDKCIESLTNQTLKEIEIIMVNDGSPDNSEKIIKKWIKKDSRIKLYNKENGGQASARNLGLTKATGEYIAFVDSDDYVDKKMYEELYNQAKLKKLDILLCNYLFDYGNNNIVKNEPIFENEGYISVSDYMMSSPGPCNKIYKKAFLDKAKFKFPEGFIYEDLAVIPILGIHNPKVEYINKCYYYYFQSPTSTLRNIEYKTKYEDLFTAIEYLYNNVIDKGYNEELEHILTCHFLYLGSHNFYKYKKYEMVDKIGYQMKKYFPKWHKNKYLKEKFSKKEIIYMLLFYNRQYKIINIYRKLFNRQ